MKTHISNGRNGRLLGSLLVAISLINTPALGQPDANERRSRRPAESDENRFAPGNQFRERLRQSPNAPAALPLLRVLTPEQRRSFREAMMDEREKLRELNEELRAARSELLDAALTEDASERRVRARARRVSELQTELMVLTTEAISKITPPLSPEQIEDIKNPQPPGLRHADGERAQRYRDGDAEFRRDDNARPRDGRRPADRNAPNRPPRPFPED